MRKCFSYIVSLLFLSLLLPVAVSAQDVVFNHLLSAPTYSNPAFAGAFGRYHAGVTARSQFTASANIYNVVYAEANAFLPAWNSGIGLFVMNDRSSGSVFQTTAIGASYSYAFRLADDIVLRPALQAVFYLHGRYPQSVTFPDQVGMGATAYFPYEESTKQGVDFAAGLLVQHSWLQLGASVQHIGAGRGDSLLVYGHRPLKISVHGQAAIPVSGESEMLSLKEWAAFENAVLLPQVKYIHQSGFRYLVAGATVRSGGLFAGLAVKTPLQNNTFLGVASVGLESSSLKIGYSFDFIASGGNLRGWDSGSHELFVHYSFGNPDSKASRRTKYYKGRRLNPICGCPY